MNTTSFGLNSPASSRKVARAKESDISINTRHLIKEFMKSSKLTFTQQKMLDEVIRDGTAFPVSHQKQGRRPPTVFDHSKPSPQIKMSLGKKLSIRTLDQIRDTGAYERESYRPAVMKDMTKEKEKLQELYSRNPLLDEKKEGINETQSQVGQLIDLEPDLDEMRMLIAEIQERKQWLKEMADLGKGDKFKSQIDSEIAMRIKRIKDIDKARKN